MVDHQVLTPSSRLLLSNASAPLTQRSAFGGRSLSAAAREAAARVNAMEAGLSSPEYRRGKRRTSVIFTTTSNTR